MLIAGNATDARAELVGDFEATAVAAREEPRFAGVATAPDRPDGVDHEAGGEPEPSRGLGVAERAPVQVAAGVEQFGAGRPVDRAVDAAPAEQRGVGRVDDGVDVLSGDVAERDLQVRAHEAQRRFADRGAAGTESPHTGVSAEPWRRCGIIGRGEETPCARAHDRS